MLQNRWQIKVVQAMPSYSHFKSNFYFCAIPSFCIGSLLKKSKRLGSFFFLFFFNWALLLKHGPTVSPIPSFVYLGSLWKVKVNGFFLSSSPTGPPMVLDIKRVFGLAKTLTQTSVFITQCSKLVSPTSRKFIWFSFCFQFPYSKIQKIELRVNEFENKF